MPSIIEDREPRQCERVTITKSRSGHYTVTARNHGFVAKRGKLASIVHARNAVREVREEAYREWIASLARGSEREL